MKLIRFILSLFLKRTARSGMFSEALKEGIKDWSEEMGGDGKTGSGPVEDKTGVGA